MTINALLRVAIGKLQVHEETHDGKLHGCKGRGDRWWVISAQRNDQWQLGWMRYILQAIWRQWMVLFDTFNHHQIEGSSKKEMLENGYSMLPMIQIMFLAK